VCAVARFDTANTLQGRGRRLWARRRRERDVWRLPARSPSPTASLTVRSQSTLLRHCSASRPRFVTWARRSVDKIVIIPSWCHSDSVPAMPTHDPSQTHWGAIGRLPSRARIRSHPSIFFQAHPPLGSPIYLPSARQRSALLAPVRGRSSPICDSFLHASRAREPEHPISNTDKYEKMSTKLLLLNA
jgi:hypothetical protein